MELRRSMLASRSTSCKARGRSNENAFSTCADHLDLPPLPVQLADMSVEKAIQEGEAMLAALRQAEHDGLLDDADPNQPPPTMQ
jgi:hypothetical protein